MATYGITTEGFVRKPLTQIFSDLQQKAKDELGGDINTGEDSPLTHLLATYADQVDELWQGLEGVYSAQTINGAEGFDLDDILSRQGVYRRGKQKGSGVVYLVTDNSVPNNKVIPVTTEFTAGSFKYVPTEEVIIGNNNVSSYIITSDDITLNLTYTLTIVNTSTETLTTSASYTPTSLTEVRTMLNDFESFIVTNKPELNAKVWFDYDSNNKSVLVVGYDFFTQTGQRQFVANPLSNPIYFDLDHNLGLRTTTIPVTAKEVGKQDVLGGGSLIVTGDSASMTLGEFGDPTVTKPSGSISKLIPSFTGFVDVFNINIFNSGADNETDAEYRFRYNQIIDQVTAGTRDAVEGSVLRLPDVQKVRIYENVTATNDVTTGTDSYSFQTVVLGGNSTDIVQAIYDKKPINVNTSGDTTLNVTTSNDDIVPISFSFATIQPLNVRLTYSTKSGFDLSSTEKGLVQDSLSSFSGSTDIGEIVYNDQLKSYIFSVLPFGRLKSLTVEVKKLSDPDANYSTSDYATDPKEIPTLSSEDIVFVNF